jgi:predicted methyltransferase
MRINKSDAFREALIAIIRSDIADSDPEFNDAVIDVLVHELSTALSVEEYKEAEKSR